MTAESPGLFNACEYLLDRRVTAGDADRLAIVGADGELTYAQLLDRVQRAAAVLVEAGLEPEQRIVLFASDGVDFTALYLGAMRMGAVPVPVSTMLRAAGLAELLRDSRARLLAVTPEFAEPAIRAAAAAPELRGIVAAGGADAAGAGSVAGAARGAGAGVPVHDLDDLLAAAAPATSVYPSTPDSPAFWLYTSGTTGTSKAAMHRHGSVQVVCETYGAQVLGIRPEDRCLSAAKAFFAYGLGNSLLFPLSVGATAILEAAPARPDLIAKRTAEFGATLFFAGPTFFAAMLRTGLPSDAMAGVRLAVSAGEALPAPLYERWTTHFGVDILDGIGMTEMLHIFLSNKPGEVRPGSTGVAVPGYELAILDDEGAAVPPGTPGTLYVRGASAGTGYWSRYDASRRVFQGEWLRTGDTYVVDADGYYRCLGRTSDMLKASGMWVSPAEVEEQLLAHQAVAQAVVVAGQDADGLEKPVAYVVLRPGAEVTEDELVQYCRTGLPAYKRPRRVIFTDAYPTTATGKIRRVELRVMATSALAEGETAAGAAAASLVQGKG